ncbi:pentatricopeptide repeat-containing protein At3g49740-like [Chenopodium quinoa]|uniref:Pentatricopeptide repeat-containing protein n=1 Tax=Chenopodium quinoa TaxID=63459 RepID=A0A803KYC8_CHEQI|nr:pentatricopeptide repeat-containing protein At3g49740-like [Chenopodium quinoa]
MNLVCHTQRAKLVAKQLIKLNSQLSKLTRSNRHHDCLSLFLQIHSSDGLNPDHYSLSSALTASANIPNSRFGNQLHAHAIFTGLKAFPHVSNTLLSLYAKTEDLGSVKTVFSELGSPDNYSWTTLLSAYTKLGQVDYACQLLDEMPVRNIAPWNAVITGCSEIGYDDIAFELFGRMHMLGVRHDNYTFACVLSLCSVVELHGFGKQVHSLVFKSGCLGWSSVVNSLLTMYFNTGNSIDARKFFEDADEMVRDVITYNAMINGLASLERKEEALVIFQEMLEARLRPTELTFVSLMSSGLVLDMCLQLHAQAVKAGYEPCTAVSNAAMAMYAEHGLLDSVRKMFEKLEVKDVVSWNTMIAGYAHNNDIQLAISTYMKMQRIGFVPDEYTIGALLSSSGSLEIVQMIYALVMKNGLSLTSEVINALVSACSKQGDIDLACQIFCSMHSKNLITWNAIISGFLLNGYPVQALELFLQLQKSKIRPDVYTLTIVLSICSSVSALSHGKQVHCYILRRLFLNEISLGNGLITMYAKCGLLDWSVKVFKCMITKNIVSWNAIISALAQYGEGKLAVRYFTLMHNEIGLKPDQATFTAVLSACCRAGLICDGIRIFNAMINDYGLEPGIDHFSCLVDLLGRAGYIDEMERLIESEDYKANPNIWWTLFSACAVYGNVRLGRIVAGLLLQTEKNDPAVYVLLSNIHANAGQWEDAAQVRELMKTVRVIKQPGCSWIKP